MSKGIKISITDVPLEFMVQPMGSKKEIYNQTPNEHRS
jgi:hypothetical protein